MLLNTSEIVDALSTPFADITEAETKTPKAAGLYAFHASEDCWVALNLGPPPDARPLYVGKAESSLLGRDVLTHFGTGHTGSSTLRRSLAALLAEPLKLQARPRNPAKPAHFSNYGLEPEGDARLTEWMRNHLRLAVWPSPAGVLLGDIETLILGILQPPLNLSKVRTEWSTPLKSARVKMATEARNWAGQHRY